ncbi:MAG: class I SAM-dependent methyltransferase [Saprospiraceae bacterium]|nr:class I SAM-dependent methyltransferase [Saprospiraceae bacterium]
MKLKIVAENPMEWLALKLNLVPKPLMDTQVAFTQARAIMAAAELDIFEAMGKEKKSFAQIAEKCKTHPEATKQLLDALTGIGYLNWNNGLYAIKPSYHKWLLKEYPSNYIGKLRFQLSEWNWLTKMEEYVKTGKPMELHSVISESEWANYQEGMRDLSVNTAAELAGKIKLPKGELRMLDIGGSHGLYSIELCKKHPGLTSTILELPGAVDRASAIAARYGLGERVRYKAGDVLKEDLGDQKYDLIMINNVVHHFTEEQNVQLAQKVTKALKARGIFAIGEFIRGNKPGAGGAVASGAGLYFAFTSESGTWSEEEITAWQQSAGLKSTKSIGLMTLPGWKSILAQK